MALVMANRGNGVGRSAVSIVSVKDQSLLGAPETRRRLELVSEDGMKTVK